MYLLDTNVISEMRKVKTQRIDPGFQQWFIESDVDGLYLSTITVLELETGIAQLNRKDALQAKVLERWLHDYVLTAFAGRILPVDVEVALRCAALHVPRIQPLYDALIAATALVHRMTVVTRSVADFVQSGVPVLNPWNHGLAD